MLIVYDSGDFDIHQVVDNQLYVAKSNKQHEHSGLILQISVHNEFAVTVGCDCYVRVWSLYPKQLMR